jgi:ABC-type transporter lipoprotein component MlaA
VARIGSRFSVPRLDTQSVAANSAADLMEWRLYTAAFAVLRKLDIGLTQDNGAASGLQLLEIVDGRVSMLPMDEFRRDALDDYLFVRDAWAQRRNHQIHKDLRSTHD